MADLVQIGPGETDLGKIVAALRAVIERFPATEDTAASAVADMAQATIKGRKSGAGTGPPEDMTPGETISVLTGAGADAASSSGNRFGVLPVVGGDGVMEIGRYLDFHNSDGDTSDNAVRLETGGSTTDLYINPAAGGTSVVLKGGLQTIWLPSAGMVGYPGATPGQTTYTSGGFSAITYDFDQTTLEAVNFQIAMPKSWDKGNIFFVPYWTATGGSGAVVWNLFAAAISDNEALNATISTSVSSTDTFQNANRAHIGPISAGLTPDGSPANDDMIYFALNRDPTSGSDTLTADARLIGVKVLYSVNAGNDS